MTEEHNEAKIDREALQAELGRLARDPNYNALKEALLAQARQDSPSEPGEGEPTDAEMYAAFEPFLKGEGQASTPNERAADTDTEEPSDEALWGAFTDSWKGENS